MFGKNEITGRKNFHDAGERLLVTSIFLTLQGEGPFQGRPAIFVRMAKCNLACSFCDTYFDHGDWFKTSDLSAEIYMRAKTKFPISLRRDIGVVITGGEPSLQPQVSVLLHQLEIVPFAFTQIETNGILFLDLLPEKTTLVVSPKAAEKEGKATHYLKPRDNVLERANCLKFVMSAELGTPYCTVPDWALQWRRDTGKPIYVSPMNCYLRKPAEFEAMELRKVRPDLALRTRNEVISFWEDGLLDMGQNKLNHEYAARYALDHGLFLTLQQHLFASLA
jgi:7-carboxy-7-deazaguanine synthase